jgi:hypothetical protein
MSPPGRGQQRTETWGVSEVVDLEAQIFADRSRSERALLERDAKIAHDLQRCPHSPSSVLATWVRAIREKSKANLPGQAIEHAYRQANGLLVLVLFLAGLGSASAVLRFSGEHPINVLVVLGVFVFGQMLALTITVAGFAVAAWVPALFENRPIVVLVRAGVTWLWRRGRQRLSFAGERAEAFDWMRGRWSLYGRVERHLLFCSLQRSAVAFNLGILLAFVVAVTFTDLAFGWSTTLRVGAEELHRVCRILAAPWASWLPDATISEELVRATQYSRLEGQYVEAVAAGHRLNPVEYGQWWRFLVASIVTYGLLPRLVLVACGRWMLRRALEQLPPSTPEVQQLLFRLSGSAVRSRHSADPGNVARLGEGYDPIREPPRQFEHSHGLCTRWRDADFELPALESLLRERYGMRIEGELGSAGGHDYQGDEEFLARVEESDAPIFVVAEPWGYPDRSFQRFVSQLRASAGDDRIVNVVLTESRNSDDRAIWVGYLSEMADPFLTLDREPMPTSRSAR